MSELFVKMLTLQGEIRLAFMSLGVDAEKANELAQGAVHRFLTSDLVTDEAKQLYQKMLNKTSNDN